MLLNRSKGQSITSEEYNPKIGITRLLDHFSLNILAFNYFESGHFELSQKYMSKFVQAKFSTLTSMWVAIKKLVPIRPIGRFDVN